MDPYNNPNHQAYPPQNTAQQPQAYYPPMQGPYPQQNDPTIQNTSYSGYDPNQVNPYPPQQSPIYLPSDKLKELDQGCFACYRILLYIYIFLLILGAIQLIGVDYGYYSYFLFSDVAFVIFRLVFIVIELVAIEKKDLYSAKVALIGFVIFLIAFPAYTFGVVYSINGFLPDYFVVQVFIEISIFVLVVLIGSIPVYLFLKKNARPATDRYQAVNNTA